MKQTFSQTLAISITLIVLIQGSFFPLDSEFGFLAHIPSNFKLIELLFQCSALILALSFQLIAFADNSHNHTLKFSDLLAWILLVVTSFFCAGKIFDYQFDQANSIALVKYPGVEVLMQEDGLAYIGGEIGYTTLLSLIELNENKTIRFIELNSPGGIIDAAMGIDRYLIEEGISTIVVEKCESACVLIAIGDKQLHVNQTAKFGFHNAASLAHETSQRGKLSSKAGSEFMFNELSKKGVPERIIREAELTPADEMYYVSGADFIEIGLAKAIQ